MDFNKKTERKDITISGATLSVIAPFTEGHVLTENEAAVLNQTFSENMRNNFSSVVKAAKDEVDGDVSKLNKDELQAKLDEYMKEYEFGVRRTGTARVIDPVERKALSLAKQAVRDQIKAKGFKISDVSAAQITDYAQALLEKTPMFMEEAKKQLAASDKIAQQTLDGLDDLLGGASTDEAA